MPGSVALDHQAVELRRQLRTSSVLERGSARHDRELPQPEEAV